MDVKVFFDKLFRKIQNGWIMWAPLTFWQSQYSENFLKNFGWLISQGQLPNYIKQYRKYVKAYDARYMPAMDPVLVYQMMKVGSVTVCRSLAPVLNHDILNIHFLAWENFSSVARCSIPDPQYIVKRIAITSYTRAQIEKYPERRWKVVVLVREPVARNLSLFFYFIHLFEKDLIFGTHHGDSQSKVAELLKIFEQQRYAYSYYGVMEKWFDTELKQTFGVDVFSETFPKQKGYKIYQGIRADVLLLRLEDINSYYQEAFREFLHIEMPDLINSNTSQDNKYEELYNLFKHSVNVSSEYLDKLYSLRYVRHCYTEQEINRFKVKWSRSGPGALEN